MILNFLSPRTFKVAKRSQFYVCTGHFMIPLPTSVLKMVFLFESQRSYGFQCSESNTT